MNWCIKISSLYYDKVSSSFCGLRNYLLVLATYLHIRTYTHTYNYTYTYTYTNTHIHTYIHRYFMMAGAVVLNVQKGVFRTNCIDCLDRTNVVQSMLAKKSLLTQLQVHTYSQPV